MSFLLRVLMVGDTQSGKTSLFQRFFTGTFSQNAPTIYVPSMSRYYIYPHGKTIKIQIIDLSAMNTFKSHYPMFYNSNRVVICAYDITNLESYTEAQAYAKEVREVNPNALIVIVGNKSDLFQQIKVPHHQASQYAQDNGFLFGLTSAKLDTGIIELMKMIAERIDQLQSSAIPQP